MQGNSNTSNSNDAIFVPYNENTVHIYEAFAQVAKEIVSRQLSSTDQTETEQQVLS